MRKFSFWRKMWVLVGVLAPLPVGDHTLHYKGTLSNFDFTLEIHYLIHVVPAK